MNGAQGHTAVLYKMRPRFVAVGQGLALLTALVALGACILHWTEGTGVIDGIFWAVSTLATVGARHALFCVPTMQHLLPC